MRFGGLGVRRGHLRQFRFGLVQPVFSPIDPGERQTREEVVRIQLDCELESGLCLLVLTEQKISSAETESGLVERRVKG